jgi:hypothetical protein
MWHVWEREQSPTECGNETSKTYMSFERQRVNGRATLTWILNFKNVGYFDWINLAEDRNTF